jgi:CelD/BcsL family acetyltransferase involved in cellulose biosynthesis
MCCSMSLRAEVIHDAAALARLTVPWRALLDRASAPSLCKTPTWLLAWWRQFGGIEGRKLCVVALHDPATGDLVALLPLCRRTVMVRRVLPVRRLELLATGEDQEDEICSDYTGAIVASGYEAEVAEVTGKLLVEGRLGGFDHLVMARMSGEDPFAGALADALGRAGLQTSLEDEGACPYVPLPSTFDAYCQSLDRDRRYVVTRSLRELAKWAGPAGYSRVVARTPAQLAEGRAILHSLHGERWSANGHEGAFANDRFTRFHDDVMTALLDGADGRLELQWLVVADRPVVVLYNIVYRGRIYFYQSGRKLDVPKGLRLGLAAHALALRAAMEEGCSEYDFLAGNSQYKRQLALAKHTLVTLSAAAPSVRARTAVAAAAALNLGLRRARIELTGQRDRLAAVAPEHRSRAGALALTALNRILPPAVNHGASPAARDGQGT